MGKKVSVEEIMEGASAPSSDLKRIAILGEAALALQAKLTKIEEEQTKTQKQLNEILQQQIPEIMGQCGLLSFKMENGTVLTLKDFCSGSLPKEPGPRAIALDWLRKNGGEPLIKTELSLSFGKGEDKKAQTLVKKLNKEGLNPSIEVGVHASTLQAFAREKLESGDPIDLKVLGLYSGRVAKFGKASK